MQHSRKNRILIIALVFCSAATVSISQGRPEKNKPKSPMMKSLDDLYTAIEQIEPRIKLVTMPGDETYQHVIDQPGSYYLDANLVIIEASGIYIDSENVTLDLGGFEVSRASGNGGHGVFIGGGINGVTIRNGIIRGFSNGIRSHYTPVYPKGCVFKELTIIACSNYGLVSGDYSRIMDCRAILNGGPGISAGAGSVLSGCVVADNQYGGLHAGEGSSLSSCVAKNNKNGGGMYVAKDAVLHGCVAEGNEGAGISGGEEGSILTDCIASGNLRGGIWVGAGSTLRGCATKYNQGNIALHAGSGSVLTGCVAYDNQCDIGIYADAGSTFRGCTAVGNKGSGLSSYGIFAQYGCVVIECAARFNRHANSINSAVQGAGFYIGSGSSIKNCAASDNRGSGIQLLDATKAEENTCERNGYGTGDGAGIHVTGRNNRIDGNSMADNDRGLDVDSDGNLIVRNSASDNGVNFDIVGGNKVGTISSSPSSAGPWDNFEF